MFFHIEYSKKIFNRYNLLVLLVPLCVNGFFLCNAQDTYVIRGYPLTGFWSVFMQTINHFAYCERTNKVPVVNWDSSFLYYDPTITYTQNAWEYYFEQPAGQTLLPGSPAGNCAWIHEISDSLMYTNRNIRHEVNRLFNKYVRIKPFVTKQVDEFYDATMRGYTIIGIHIRGTDKKDECNPIDPRLLLSLAQELADKLGQQRIRFFIATDEAATIELAQKMLASKVIFYNAIRSADELPVHYISRDKFKLGLDVLIDAALLSRCQYLIHAYSSVVQGAILLNPDIKNMMIMAQMRQSWAIRCNFVKMLLDDAQGNFNNVIPVEYIMNPKDRAIQLRKIGWLDEI